MHACIWMPDGCLFNALRPSATGCHSSIGISFVLFETFHPLSSVSRSPFHFQLGALSFACPCVFLRFALWLFALCSVHCVFRPLPFALRHSQMDLHPSRPSPFALRPFSNVTLSCAFFSSQYLSPACTSSHALLPFLAFQAPFCSPFCFFPPSPFALNVTSCTRHYLPEMSNYANTSFLTWQ